MAESIFSRLFRYKATEKTSPEENYLTEMLCWLINNCPCFANDYIELLKNKINDEDFKSKIEDSSEIQADTQIYVSKGIIDMVIYAGQNVGFICEHKVNSTLRDNQIQDYVKCQTEIRNDSVFKSILLTKSTYQHTQDADIKMIWNDLYNHIQDNIENYYEDEKKIINQFLDYLTEVGMGKKKALSVATAKEYCNIHDFETTLKSIFNDIKDDMNDYWENKCPGIMDFTGNKDNFSVSVNKHYGRFGINFSKKWDPINLFAGVLLDNNDHKITHFNNCSQFVVMVDCTLSERSKTVDSDKYRYLKALAIPNDYKYETEPQNLWRIAILSKPLTEIIENKNYEEQKKSIQNEIIKGINIILGNNQDV